MILVLAILILMHEHRLNLQAIYKKLLYLFRWDRDWICRQPSVAASL